MAWELKTIGNWIIGFLIVTVALGAVTITLMDQGVKLKVDKDYSTFYVKEGSRWIVSGKEAISLYSGSTKLTRNLSAGKIETFEDKEKQQVLIIKTTMYSKGPSITEKYLFDGSLSSKELFPIYHTVNVDNAKGYYLRYDVTNLYYSGATYKLTNQLTLSFDKKMKVTLNPDYRWAWVYSLTGGKGKVSAQYGIASNYESFEFRLFDPDEVPSFKKVSNDTATGIVSANITSSTAVGCSLWTNTSRKEMGYSYSSYNFYDDGGDTSTMENKGATNVTNTDSCFQHKWWGFWNSGGSNSYCNYTTSVVGQTGSGKFIALSGVNGQDDLLFSFNISSAMPMVNLTPTCMSFAWMTNADPSMAAQDYAWLQLDYSPAAQTTLYRFGTSREVSETNYNIGGYIDGSAENVVTGIAWVANTWERLAFCVKQKNLTLYRYTGGNWVNQKSIANVAEGFGRVKISSSVIETGDYIAIDNLTSWNGTIGEEPNLTMTYAIGWATNQTNTSVTTERPFDFATLGTTGNILWNINCSNTIGNRWATDDIVGYDSGNYSFIISGNSCSYSGGSTWTIPLAAHCNITTPTFVSGAINLTGTGNFTCSSLINATRLVAPLTGQKILIEPGCRLITRG